ncbi:MAG: hypothetical protein ACLFQX_03995, partial [Candidatus Kapaibacterium sp.]
CLNKYIKELNNIEKIVKKQKLDATLHFVEIYLPKFANENHLFNKNMLIKIKKKKNEHERYQNVIDYFYKELMRYSRDLIEKMTSYIHIIEILTDDEAKSNEENYNQNNNCPLDEDTSMPEQVSMKDFYNIADTNLFEFRFNLIKSKISNNETITNEFVHMRKNLGNELEYYSSLYLIEKELETGNTVE